MPTIISKLPRRLWAEATTTICYMVNRGPLGTIKFETPKEIWTEVPANYKHLKIFKCPTYVHIKQDKLDVRALKGLFVGYLEGVKKSNVELLINV